MAPEPKNSAPPWLLERAGKSWVAWSAMATAVLYASGYFALRAHITALGIGTDLGVLDEHYLFAGAKFFVFLGTCIPLVALAGMIGWVLYAWARRADSGRRPEQYWSPTALTVAGIAIAFAAIQYRMKPCFAVHDAPFGLPKGPDWMIALLKAQNGAGLTLFFFELLLLTAIVIGLLTLAVYGMKSHEFILRERMLAGIHGAMALAMLLLLPVNFGVLVMPYSMGRVSGTGKTALQPNQSAWLMWEGKEWLHYLVRTAPATTPGACPAQWSVVAYHAKDVEKVELLGYETLFDLQQCKTGNQPARGNSQSNAGSGDWTQTLAGFLGVSGDVRLQKGVGGSSGAGQLRIAEVGKAATQPLSPIPCTWPVFDSSGQSVYALDKDTLLRIPASGGVPVRIGRVERAIKLIGFDTRDDSRLLAIRANPDQTIDVIVVSTSGAVVEVLAAKQRMDSPVITALMSSFRDYQGWALDATDEYITLKPPNQDAQTIAECPPDTRCGQPSYSPKTQRVVYIQSKTQP